MFCMKKFEHSVLSTLKITSLNVVESCDGSGTGRLSGMRLSRAWHYACNALQTACWDSFRSSSRELQTLHVKSPVGLLSLLTQKPGTITLQTMTNYRRNLTLKLDLAVRCSMILQCEGRWVQYNDAWNVQWNDVWFLDHFSLKWFANFPILEYSAECCEDFVILVYSLE